MVPYSRSNVKWQTVPDAWSIGRKRPVTDGGQPRWRYTISADVEDDLSLCFEL